MDWRRQHRIDSILDEFKPPEVLAKYFPAGFVGQDKLKNPRKNKKLENLLKQLHWKNKRLVKQTKKNIRFFQCGSFDMEQQT